MKFCTCVVFFLDGIRWVGKRNWHLVLVFYFWFWYKGRSLHHSCQPCDNLTLRWPWDPTRFIEHNHSTTIRPPLTTKDARFSIYHHLHNSYELHQVHESHFIDLCVWSFCYLHCFTLRRNWKHTHIRHWWSKHNTCICMKGHPYCIFELKALINQLIQIVHLKNKFTFGRVQFDRISYNKKYMVQTLYFLLCLFNM